MWQPPKMLTVKYGSQFLEPNPSVDAIRRLKSLVNDRYTDTLNLCNSVHFIEVNENTVINTKTDRGRYNIFCLINNARKMLHSVVHQKIQTLKVCVQLAFPVISSFIFKAFGCYCTGIFTKLHGQ